MYISANELEGGKRSSCNLGLTVYYMYYHEQTNIVVLPVQIFVLLLKLLRHL